MNKKKIDVFDIGSAYSEYDLKTKCEMWYCELIWNNKVVGSLQHESRKDVEKLAKRWLVTK